MLDTLINANYVEEIIYNSIRQVIIDNEMDVPDLTLQLRLVQDLNFTSLMIAQLIMLVQEEIESEPFASDYAISDMVTVADYVNVYS